MCLKFEEINLKNKELIIKYRAVGFYTSFGSEDDFWEEDGHGGERYFEWLKSRNPKKFTAFHVLLDNQIIGQLELNTMEKHPAVGWVNYFFLTEQNRGKGLAYEMQQFLIDYYRNKEFLAIRLAVSPSNKRAYRFYLKMGWKFIEEKEYINKDGINLGHKIHILEINL